MGLQVTKPKARKPKPRLRLTEIGLEHYTRKRAWTTHEAAALLNGEPPSLKPSQAVQVWQGKVDIGGDRYRACRESISRAIERGALEPNADGKLKPRDVVIWAYREGLMVPSPFVPLLIPDNLTVSERAVFLAILLNPHKTAKQLEGIIRMNGYHEVDWAVINRKIIGSLRKKLKKQGIGRIEGRQPGYVFKQY